MLACLRILALVSLGTAGLSHAVTPDAEAIDRGSDIAYRRALAPAAIDRRLNADAAAIARVRRITTRLAVSAGTREPDSKRYVWAVNFVPGAAPDVLVYPGGRVIVTEGVITNAGLGDEEVAGILAHAFAHSLLGHDARRIAASVSAREPSADPNRRALDAADATAKVLRELRYTAAEVAAADRASAELMARAAYDPRASGSAWRRLRLSDKGIVQRSPITDDRLATLDASIRSALPLYEESRAKAEADARQQRLPPISGRR